MRQTRHEVKNHVSFMVGVMSQQIKKVLGVKPSDLSSVPKTHIVESYTLKKKEGRKVDR